MASSALPADFRCFRHIMCIYARNLPLLEVKRTDDTGLEASSTKMDSSTACGAVHYGCGERSNQRCVSSYFTLSLSPRKTDGVKKRDDDGVVDNRCFYTSEVQRETQHPVWGHIPDDVTEGFEDITRFVFSLYFCTTHPEEVIPAPDTDFLFYEMLIQTSHVQYIAESMTKADTISDLPYHVESGVNSFVVMLRCVDGVFFPKHQGLYLDEGETETDVIKTPYLQEDIFMDSSQCVVGSDIVRPRGKLSHVPVERITLGDLKTCATATLAWNYFNTFASDRREEEQSLIDNMMNLRHDEFAAVAQRAMLEARLSKANEELQCLSNELCALRNQYKEEQNAVTLHSLQLEKLKSSISHEESHQEEIGLGLTEHKLPLDTLRGQLDDVKWLRIKELRALFPIQEGGTADATDTICGHKLPMGVNELVGITAETMQEWGLALGVAAHLVTTASTIYGCFLPHPLLLCGGRSSVMAKPGLPVAAVVSLFTGPCDVKLPLYCTRAADHPLMSAAIRLLLDDVAALATSMGRHDIASRAAGDDRRLGVLLKRLLNPT